ncbi:MAG TPA: YfhO family protein [Gemmataceae bacterium]|nr:YfhO family protein [Gemmataceae bacterium]
MPGAGRNGIRWERCLFFCAVAAACLFLWTLARPLRTGRIPVVMDLGYFHLPLRTWYADCLARGCGFDWMPEMYNGLFLSGEGEHGPYHPFHLIGYRFLPLDRAFALEAFLLFPLMLLGMFLFLRRHIGDAAAMLGGLLYTFSANNFCHGFHVNYLGILAHVPWLLWLIDGATSAATPTRRRLSLVGIALLTGSQLLLGQPQALSYSLLTEIVYCCFLLEPLRRPLRLGLPLLSAKLLGVLIGAVQLLATWEFLGHSTRTSMNPYLGALPFALLVQLLSPALMRLPLEGWFYEAFYLGMVPIILALCWPLSAVRCPLSANDKSRQRLAWFAVVLGILAVWLALGRRGGLYSLQTMLPMVKHFRAPGRYINLLGLAAAVLSAVMFQRLVERVRNGQPLAWRRLALPWLGVAGTLAAALAFHYAYPEIQQRNLSSSFYAGTLMALGAATALTVAARGRAIGLFALLLLAVVDLDYFCLRGPNVGEPLWRYTPTLAEWDARAPRPPACSSGRILSINVPALCLLRQGERLVNGYWGGLEPRKNLDYLRLLPLRLSGAAWYSVYDRRLLAHSPEFAPADESWHAVPAPLPRLRLLARTRVSDNPAADLERIDIETTALVTHPIDVEDGEAAIAYLLHEEPGELRIRADAPGSRLLVIADSYDRAWRVEVDGEPRSVERVDGDFLGCVLERGAHEVRFTFRPASIYYGRRLSLFGLALAVLIAVVPTLFRLAATRRGARSPRSPSGRG